MTDNQDSVTAGAVQPPTDRPLTAGDWIEWHGGENPVPGQRVEWKNAAGDSDVALSDEVCGLGRPLGPNSPITAYRILPQAPSEREQELAVLLDNLVIAQGLSRELRTSATDQARSYLYSYRHSAARPVTSAASEVEGVDYATLSDLHTIKGWLHGLATNPDLNDVVADGGVTTGDCYQQEARDFAGRIGRIIAALASPPVSERERELEGALRRAADDLRDIGSQNPRKSNSPDPEHENYLRRTLISLAQLANTRARQHLTAQPAGEGK